MTASTIVFIGYLAILIAIGMVTYARTKSHTDYTLAGRSNNKWIAAISAEASDMSGWLLMGLPGAAYFSGFASIWIVIGLIFGTLANWVFIGNRLRIATESYQAFSMTEFFEKRVNDKKGHVALISGVAIIVFMIINASAEIIGSGKLLNAIFGLPYEKGILVGVAVVIVYTFLGGYMAVSWSNLFQGTLMFFAILFVPIAVLFKTGGITLAVDTLYKSSPSFFLFCNGQTGWPAVSTIFGGLGVGVCYFGMVHVLTCFMSIKHSSEIKDSTFIATTWVSLSTLGAVMIGMLGACLFPAIEDPEQVFFIMGRDYFPPYLLGLFAAAVMAAILSSVSAYVIVATGAFGANIIKKLSGETNDKKLVMIERASVIVISFLAFLISLKPDVVFKVALLASAGLGASFGPLVLFSLYSKKLNKTGAIASILTGLVVVIVWYYSGLSNYIYEVIPGFLASGAALILFTRLSGGADADSVRQYESYRKKLKNKGA